MTQIDQVHLLTGDPGAVLFTDDQIQAFLDMTTMQAVPGPWPNAGPAAPSTLLAAALACDCLAVMTMANAGGVTTVKIGDYSQTLDAAKFTALAEQYRKVEYETPAFDIVEDDLSYFNALQIIRNYILRTEP